MSDVTIAQLQQRIRRQVLLDEYVDGIVTDGNAHADANAVGAALGLIRELEPGTDDVERLVEMIDRRETLAVAAARTSGIDPDKLVCPVCRGNREDCGCLQ